MEKEEFLLRPQQASKMLGVNIDTLRLWEVNGKIKATFTCGGHRRYYLDEITAIKESTKKNG